jgi:hypothetical protein
MKTARNMLPEDRRTVPRTRGTGAERSLARKTMLTGTAIAAVLAGTECRANTD